MNREKPDLDWLAGYRSDQPNFGLERMEALLALRGKPHLKLSVIHIGGTNGKGSTLAHLRELLQLKGLRVGTFTSPYLTCYEEQVMVDGQPISAESLAALLQEYRYLLAQADSETFAGLTEFEILTALAYDYFAKESVDVALIEVGMGGRLDSTNVCQPDVAVITSVGLDHVALLGDNLAAIAREKAGIVKAGVTLLTGKLPEEALLVMEEVAGEKQAVHLAYGRDYQVLYQGKRETGTSFDFVSSKRVLARYQTPLLGQHQAENAALALATCDQYCLKKSFPLLTDEEVEQAFARVRWPGRLEQVRRTPAIYLDGAHNPHAILALRETLKQAFPEKKLRLLFACIQTKALEEMLALLEDLPELDLTLTSFEDERAVPRETMEKIAEQQALSYQPWESYVEDYLEEKEEGQILVVTGSLYFLVQVRAYLMEKGKMDG